MNAKDRLQVRVNIYLAWLVFYYIQRFRYMNAKDKLQVRGQYLKDIPTSILILYTPSVLFVQSVSINLQHRISIRVEYWI